MMTGRVRTLLLTGLVVCVATEQARAESLASTMEIYVFPKAGQDSAQQSMDEAACYEWAVENTGSDPFTLAEQAQTDTQQAQQEQQAAAQEGRGSAARGAVRGAAAGALIGEIASDDAGEGAAWGAAAGVVRGRRKGNRTQAEATQLAQAEAAQREAASEHQLANFTKAFSVCLEGKEYLVK
jgi:hypothetical protein